MAHPQGLAALEARLAQDLAWLELPPKAWIPPQTHDGQAVLDVVVIGGGMAGLTAAAALKMLGIHAVVLDKANPGQEGPWVTSARMETLRSPKVLTGPALGLPALTFRAWYEAQFGIAAWDALDKIPRPQWMDYLRWFRRVMAVDLRNAHTVEAIEPTAEGHVRLQVRQPGRVETLLARRVVLATGRDGLGSAWLPPEAQHIPADRRAHSADLFDEARLRGLRVAVVGGSASAMDCAATALEAGAERVDLLVRRSVLPRINKVKGSGNPGITHGYQHLPDEWKWRLRHYMNVQQTPPPRGSSLRVFRHPNAHMHLGSPLLSVRDTAQGLWLTTPKAEHRVDFVIFCTGFRVALTERPELAAIAPHLKLWSDRYQPAAGDEDEELSSMPDLGPAFEFQPKQAGSCPGLERVHCFCYPAAMSHGQVSGDIPAISDGAQRLARGIASHFYGEDVKHHEQAIHDFADPELLGDEWPAADVIDRMVPLPESDPLHAIRHQRAKVVNATQQSYDALLSPGLESVPLRERLLLAWYACRLTPHPALAAHYRERLNAYGIEEDVCQAIEGDQLSLLTDARLRALLAFTRTLILNPVQGDRAALQTLPQAGYSTPAVVAIAQLIAFLSYQTRVVSGLSALQQARAASQENAA